MFYILINKVSESETDAVYSFYDTAYPEEKGELRLDKASETIEMTKNSRDSFFQRAARKVILSYRDGKLPEKLCWAS
jgi:hypothetical protein